MIIFPTLPSVEINLFLLIFVCGFIGVGGGYMITTALMVLGAAVGAQIGAIGTRYVRGVSVRYILSYSVFLAAIGSIFKLAYIFTRENISWLQTGAEITIFGSMALLVSMVIALIAMAVLYRKGRAIPAVARSLVSKED